jgi:hypothetical protein
VVTVIDSATIAEHELADAAGRGLAVGEQDDVLLARLHHRQVLVGRVERGEDLGAAARLDARDVGRDAVRLRACCIFT